PGSVADMHNQIKMIIKLSKRNKRPTRVLNSTRSYQPNVIRPTSDQPNKQLQRNGEARPTCHRQLGCGRNLNLLGSSSTLLQLRCNALRLHNRSSKTEYGRYSASPRTTQGVWENAKRGKIKGRLKV